MPLRPSLLGITLCLLAVLPAHAEERPLEADRPDKTEGAHTVPAGRVQLELHFASASIDVEEGQTEVGFLPFNVRLGLLDDVDLQLIASKHATLRGAAFAFEPPELTFRLKMNLIGNDEGRFVLALMPYFLQPGSGHSTHARVGLVAPFALELPFGLGLGGQLQVELAQPRVSDGWAVETIATLELSRTLVGDLSAYVELWASFAPATAAAVATLDVGLKYSLGPDLRLDAGLNAPVFGTSTVELFAGMTRRF